MAGSSDPCGRPSRCSSTLSAGDRVAAATAAGDVVPEVALVGRAPLAVRAAAVAVLSPGPGVLAPAAPAAAAVVLAAEAAPEPGHDREGLDPCADEGGAD